MDIHEGETPSPTEEVDPNAAAPVAQEGQDANTSSPETPSTSEPDAKSKPQDLSSVVEAALKGKGAPSPSEKPPVDPKLKAGDQDPKAAKAAGEGTDADIPKEFHKHPAWQKLKNQRDQARADVERYKGDSDEFQAITGFMAQHEIRPEQVADIMHLIVLQKNDPVKFYETVAGFKEELDQKMGFALPKDLQDRVAAGEINEEDAKELNRAKAEKKLIEQTRAEQAQRSQARTAEDAEKQIRQQCADVVNQWEKGISARDLDYGRKQRLVQSEIRSYIQQYGAPKSPEQALKYAQVAYEEITKQLTGILPEKKPNLPTPQTGRNSESKFAPKSVEDVVSNILLGGS